MKKIFSILLNVLFITVLSHSFAYSQKTEIYNDCDLTFKKAVEFFEKEKYGTAQNLFEEVLRNYGETPSLLKNQAEYYVAICAVELFNEDAEYLIAKFIEENPESSQIQDAYFQLGKHQYRKKKYIKAIEFFEKVELDKLSKEDVAEYRFKKGYSHFSGKEYKKASEQFYEIKDIDSKYTVPALYYYSHIAYLDKNYETALQGFEKLTKNETFAPIVPYYLSQIFYFQKKYDKLIEYASPLLEVATTKRQPEIARLLGEAMYRQNKFAEAVPFLEKYKEKAVLYEETDIYELGYAYYRTKMYPQAVEQFKKVLNNKSEIAQNSFYHLGDCYLKLKDKSNARAAFLNASEMNFDADISEDALYNYAKLSYELADFPFNEALKAIGEFLQKYPKSENADEAYDYLGKMFMSTKNYQGAIESFEKVARVNSKIEAAYQRVTYFRGLELFNDLKFDLAIKNFDKSLANGKYNNTYKAESNYWKAEALYRQEKYSSAIENYKQFLLTTGAILLPEYDIAHYNLGYAYFKIDNYKEAILWFRKYTNNRKEESTKMVGDAFVRIADCYFVDRDFSNAVVFYDKAVTINTFDVDYAMFQKGFSQGLMKEHNQKIISLNMLLDKFPNSNYCDDALYELGRSYAEVEQNDMAIATYQKILTDYASSSYAAKSQLQLGLIYYNSDKLDDALAVYKQVAETAKGTDDSKDALKEIQKIYVDKNDIDTYIDYTKNMGVYANVTETEQDSLIYISAEKMYMEGKNAEALTKFDNYISKFKNGAFLLNANYYKAECNMSLKQTDEALKAYEFVIAQPKNKFSENALLKSARIHYEKANYEKALANYSQLEKISELRANVQEALIGKMDCSYKLEKFDDAIKSAISVLLVDKLPDENFRQAHYILAKSYLEKNEIQSATEEFELLSQDCKNAEGAESKFRLIEIYFNNKDYDKAEKEIFDFVKLNSSHQYWLAKSFLVLSDIYVVRKDNFQAKHTLYSVTENYANKTDGIFDQAQERLSKILEAEQAENQLKEVMDIQLNFDENIDGKYDKLFKDDSSEEELKQKILNETIEIKNDSIPNQN